MINFRQNIQTNVLRTLIIDDEAHVRESLNDMLKHHCPNAKVIGQAEGVKTGHGDDHLKVGGLKLFSDGSCSERTGS